MTSLKKILKRKLLVAALIVFAAHISLGSFTGTTDESSKNKYSLKNFNRNFYKKASPYSLRADFQFKGVQVISQQVNNSGITYNSILRYEKGNTTYIYPYKHRVNIPKFKTPVAPTVQ